MSKCDHPASLAEVLDDPILDLLLKRDGVSRDDLDHLIEDVRGRLHHGHDEPEG